MSIVVRPRSPVLAPFVASLGYAESSLPPGLERVLPSGDMSLMVNLHEDEFRTYDGRGDGTVHRVHGAILQGPQAQATMIDTEEQRCVVTVCFSPGGAAPFFAVPASATRDLIVGLDEVWGRDGAVLRERLLEATTPQERLALVEDVLLDHVVRPLNPDRAVDLAVAAFERGHPVAEVTSRLGVLPKAFVRRFRDRIGVTPKRFSRVRRFQRVIGAIERNGTPASWAGLAVEHGYCDQAHMIHDFRELAGITPTAYRARSAAAPNHVQVAAPAG